MKKIISVGYEIPGNSDLYIPYSSNKSLLDSEIVIFCPEFKDYDVDYINSSYRGKILYSEDGTSNLKEDTNHWKDELDILLKDGKTIFVLLKRLEEFYIHTGEKNFSGTGKNARITNIVTNYDNYHFLPSIDLSLAPSTGKKIKFPGNPIFSVLWKDFSKHFEYENYINENIKDPLFTTETGKKAVGSIHKIGKGYLILLPMINYDEDKFVYYDKKKKEPYWTKEAVEFGNRLIKDFIEIDKALSVVSGLTPQPDWVKSKKYQFITEVELQTQIDIIDSKIKDFIQKKQSLQEKINKEQELKMLLYESGKPLERAVVNALRKIDYKAENFKEGDLEIDQLIVSPEGDRFIAETEGKDNSPINIDKIRQLSSNIQEDLARDKVSKAADGILFGNGFRLIVPEKRDLQFTEKCQSIAKKFNYILITTDSLFSVARYLKENKNTDFAKKCRKKILSSKGTIVKFPSIPKK